MRLTVYSVLCQHGSALLLAFTLSYTKNVFCQEEGGGGGVQFQPIGPSPACYLSTGLIADGSSPRFSSPANNEHAVTGCGPGRVLPLCW